MKRKKKLNSRESVIAWATDNDHTVTMVPINGFKWMIEVRHCDDGGGIPAYNASTWEDVLYQIEHNEWVSQEAVRIV